ncbi:MAG: uracil-DNA glycosylase [Lachnospiraceae bacterium]|nr:uracil-DNA glycosylase [Lachnospiraceae bacterium]
MAKITNDWLPYLEKEYGKPYYKQLYIKVREEYRNHEIFPPADDIFNALHLTPREKVKVVILGQDPYHTPGAAHGLAFSVPKTQPVPPSLKNIYAELHEDIGFEIPDHGNLVSWAEQGVLLLNTVLTVRAHVAGSHRNFGWEEFTDAIISSLDEEDRPMVFMLWGAPAGKKEVLITNPRHLILKAPHPSPLSAYRGFFGCRHFSKANEFLEKNGVSPVDWTITP